MLLMPWDIEGVKIEVSKHFAIKYLKSWGWDFNDLRDAIREAYKIEKVGKEKYEVYTQKNGFKKIILVYIEERIVCITGSTGGKRQ